MTRYRVDLPVRSQSLLAHRRSALVVAAVVVALAVGFWLYHRPAHHVDTRYEATWTAEVKSLTSTHATGACVDPTSLGTSDRLRGVGAITSVCVGPVGRWPHAEVTFWLGQGLSGVAYANGYPPPYDMCVTPLGGSWWQVVAMNDLAMSCPRGYGVQPAA
ncbi:MAG: hypothetical protein ACRDV0_08755 [Acidimicrobiales bacterium]